MSSLRAKFALILVTAIICVVGLATMITILVLNFNHSRHTPRLTAEQLVLVRNLAIQGSQSVADPVAAPGSPDEALQTSIEGALRTIGADFSVVVTRPADGRQPIASMEVAPGRWIRGAGVRSAAARRLADPRRLHGAGDRRNRGRGRGGGQPGGPTADAARGCGACRSEFGRHAAAASRGGAGRNPHDRPRHQPPVAEPAPGHGGPDAARGGGRPRSAHAHDPHAATGRVPRRERPARCGCATSTNWSALPTAPSGSCTRPPMRPRARTWRSTSSWPGWRRNCTTWRCRSRSPRPRPCGFRRARWP